MLKRIVDLIYYKSDYILLFFLLFISLLVLFSQDNSQIQTLQGRVASSFSFLSLPVKWIEQIEELVDENRRLQTELMRMRLLNSALVENEKENQRLKRLLDFKQNTVYQLVAARIINRGTTPFYNSITIDVGIEKGVKPNLPVISPDGLVGKTVAVDKGATICQLMKDINFRVSIKLQDSRAYGILRWDKNDRFLIEGIPKTIQVKKGELVITSGYSDIYPLGLLVGKVIGIDKGVEGIFQLVYAKGSVNFDTLEEVFVVLSYE